MVCKKFFSTISTNRGFTLIEILVTFALLSLVLGATITFYFMGIKAHQRGVMRTDLQQNARIAMIKIEDELRGAKGDSVDIPYPSRLDFTQADDPNTQHSFRLQGSDLEFLTGNTPAKVANHVTSLNFATGPTGVIVYTITVGVGEGEGEGEQSVTLSSSIKPRN
ncbi:prepilin-type N-terminal cleavage/methylation domain-containing protein [candidate division NPL-UPA2 bacterium]|nr:prepilin-type N-terminal cleavage/methylation domain-containing protein [candidate division NPL-UPA2 bacterium]